MSDGTLKDVQLKQDNDLVEEIRLELARKRGPKRLSAEAVTEIMSCDVDYLRDLVHESARIARDHHVDDVAKSHVQQANQRLRVSQKSPKLEIIGSLAGGSGITLFIDYWTAATPDPSQVPWMVGLLSLGFACFGAAWTRRVR